MQLKYNLCIQVLLVEDSEFDKEIFLKALNTVNPSAQCIHFENGSDAFNFLKGAMILPHFIFLDLQLPGMSGKECLKKIRQRENYSDIPISIFSASTYLKDEKDAKELGADYYIYKDRNYSSICDTLRLIFAHRFKTHHPIA